MAVQDTSDLILDKNHEAVPAFSDVCNFCRHYQSKRTCAAFPDGIPLVIWLEENDHRQPYPGDHGIQFEAVEIEAEPPLSVSAR